ncbi:MAG: leucine zipper domain-containing protein, partial [Candidatus Limnocylindria bacterium]
MQRIASGWPVSRAAYAAGISRQTGSKWWNRYRREGTTGLIDRRSVVRRQARAHPAELGERLCRLRRELRVGPHRLADRRQSLDGVRPLAPARPEPSGS